MKKKLLSCFMTMALCLSLIVGATFAWFTDNVSTGISIGTGKVEVLTSASLTDLYSPTLIGQDGVVRDETNAATDTSFVGGGTAVLNGNALTMNNIAPGDKATVSVDVTNNSTLHSKYRAYINVKPAGELWYNALDIAVNGNAYPGMTQEVIPWSNLDAGAAAQDFTLTVGLKPDAPSEIGGKQISVDFTVEAIQRNVQGSKILYEAGTPAEFDFFVSRGVSDATIRLTDDLDFSGYTFTDAYYERIYNNAFTGVLDGGIYDENGRVIGSRKIQNLTYLSSGEEAQAGLFYKAYGLPGEDPVTFKNLTFVDCRMDNSSANGAGLLAFGHDSKDCLADGKPASSGIRLENIAVNNCLLNVDRNSGILIGYARSTHFYADKVTIDAQSSISGRDVAGILGTNNNNDVTWDKKPFDMVFDDCHVSAAISGTMPGAFIGNSFYMRVGLDPEKCTETYNQDLGYHQTGVTVIKNCTFDGKLTVSSDVKAFAEHIKECPWIGCYGQGNDAYSGPHHYDCSAPDVTGSSFEGATIIVPETLYETKPVG